MAVVSHSGTTDPALHHFYRLNQLFGQAFSAVGTDNRYGLPPFYELHAWIWKRNPNGMFADYNPRVDC